MDYSGLQSAVGNFLNRSDLFGDVPTFIALAESVISRRLKVRSMVTYATTTISSQFETLPGDFAGPISMTLVPGSITPTVVLDCIAPDAMANRQMVSDFYSAQPSTYSVVGASFEFSPIPDASYSVYLVYYANVPALSASNTSNWLLAQWPDAYLYGALSQAGPYVQDARSSLWNQLFEKALEEITFADQQESYGARLQPYTSLIV